MDAATNLFPSQPLADYLAGRAEIDAAVGRVLAGGRYVLGGEVSAFEREFAAWLDESENTGVEAVGVANGTDALVLALQALGIGPGDTVVTVAHTAVATVAGIVLAGAEPLLVDIDAGRFTLDPARLEACLRHERGRCRIKAVVPVHLYGQMANMPAILAVAREHGLRVVEDCAQAVGARLEGRMAGLWGDAAAFSFYPTKNLAAAGDAGAVATRDPALAKRVRELRQYGWGADRVSRGAGRNSRLDDVQAAVLRVKLPRLHAANARRRELAAMYGRLLAGDRAAGGAGECPDGRADGSTQPDDALVPPPMIVGTEPVFHQYVIRASRRDALLAALLAGGVPAAVHYSPPVHRHPAYADGRARIDEAGLAESERAADEVLSLPIHAHLSERAIERAAALVCEWRARNAAE